MFNTIKDLFATETQFLRLEAHSSLFKSLKFLIDDELNVHPQPEIENITTFEFNENGELVEVPELF